MGRCALPVAIMLVLAGAAPATAQPGHDPDWPCIQRLVPELSTGMLWAGAPSNASDAEWQSDWKLAQLAGELAARRTPLDQADQAIAGYAEDLPPNAQPEKLALLFQGVLELINDERSRTIESIKAYARNQRRLAKRIAQENRRLDQLRQEDTAEAQTELAELRSERDWAIRIYDDRNRALRQVCDQPVQLEQRAFALARAIQSQIE
jgi:aminopeptidase N